MFVQVNLQKYNGGKDKTRKKWNDFEVREEFWEALLNFAKNDFVSYITENDTLIDTHKTEEFIECISSVARVDDELAIVDDLRFCMWGSSVSLRRTNVSSSLIKRVAHIDGNYATFYSSKTNKPFKVQISDRLLGKLKIGDEALINILMNKKWIVVDVIE